MGGYVDEAMAKAVEDASVVLVLVTNEYCQSENCNKECDYASSLRKRIIPIRVDENCDPCEINGRVGIIISGFMYIDFSKQYFQKSMNELFRQIDNQMAIINTVKNDFKISYFTKFKFYLKKNKIILMTVFLFLLLSLTALISIGHYNKDIQKLYIRTLIKEGDIDEMRRFVDMAFDNSDIIERIVTERYTIDNNKDTDFEMAYSFLSVLRNCSQKYIAFKKLQEKLSKVDLTRFAYKLKDLVESDSYNTYCENSTRKQFKELITSLPLSIRRIFFDGFVALKHKQYDQYLNVGERPINNTNDASIISTKDLVTWKFRTNDEGRTFTIHKDRSQSYLVYSDVHYCNCRNYLSLSKDIDIINTHGKFEIEFPSMESILKSSNEVNLKVNSRCIYLADLPVHHSAEGSHNAVSERCDLMPDSLKLWSIERSQNGNDSPYTKS